MGSWLPPKTNIMKCILCPKSFLKSSRNKNGNHTKNERAGVSSSHGVREHTSGLASPPDHSQYILRFLFCQTRCIRTVFFYARLWVLFSDARSGTAGIGRAAVCRHFLLFYRSVPRYPRSARTACPPRNHKATRFGRAIRPLKVSESSQTSCRSIVLPSTTNSTNTTR